MSLRDNVDSNDTLPAAGTSKAANVPSHAKTISPGMNAIELRFSSANADGDSCTAHIFATRLNDDICKVCSIAVTAGAQVSTDGRYYADTLTITDLWHTDKDIQKADAAGNDRMARLAFDALGYHTIFVMFTGISASSDWYAEFTGV